MNQYVSEGRAPASVGVRSAEKTFVYIAYIDDTGSSGRNLRDQQSPFQVVTAVIVPDAVFSSVEFFHASIIEQVVPEDKREKFEFHAKELFWAQGPFKPVKLEASRALFGVMLGLVAANELPIVYGAVDKEKLRNSPTADARPINAAFRCCTLGVEQWMCKHAPKDLGLLIADDTKNEEDKESIKNAFRDWRPRLKLVESGEVMRMAFEGEEFSEVKLLKSDSVLQHLADDMYFGDSRDSVGIQLADMCGFVINRHLSGKEDSEYLYQKIASHIAFSRVVPE
ncbi:MAG TPA: DUF3800 domain-containing protein [Terriglobia bacterium]|nr:DUF3800 domain-containing protein [Terriglobia bacterium]